MMLPGDGVGKLLFPVYKMFCVESMDSEPLAQLIWFYSLALKQEHKPFARVPVARKY